MNSGLSRNILILLVLLLAIAGIIIFLIKPKNITIFRNQDDALQKVTKEEIEIPEKPIKYSRMSFVMDQGARLSLNIPEYWEGNYRVKNQGQRVNFFYIEGSDVEELLFYISLKNLTAGEEAELAPGQIEISRQNDLIFFYSIVDKDNQVSGSYLNMTKDVPEMVKSIKIN